MSFAYLPLFTGDYLRDTQHLSCSEHGIFLKLLMHCWDQKGPAPLDERKLCGIVNARSSDEIEAMRRVLGEFFVRMEDGHYNKRMAEEVAKAERFAEASRRGGLASAEAKRAKARSGAAAKKQAPLEGQSKGSPTTLEGALVSPSPSPSPTPDQPQAKNTRATRVAAARLVVSVADLVADGVNEKHARDWIKVRGKVPLTETAWKAVKREAAAAHLTPSAAVKLSAENSWRGFKAAWVHSKPGQQSTAERDAEARRLLGFPPEGEVIDA